MSDLSVPPLSLVPVHPGWGAPAADEQRAAHREPFAWPTPPLPAYPAPTCATAPEPCDVEGLNGRVMHGVLHAFSPDEQTLRLQVPPSRAPVTLRFSQFRRLRLLHPLAPLAPSAGDGDIEALRPAQPFRIELRDGPVLQGLSIGTQATPHGVFLFEPADHGGTVRRSFVPQAAIARAELGPRLGEVLVDEGLATPHDVDSALAEQQALRSARIGEILVAREIVSADELMAAIEQQSRMPMVRIGEALLALGLITEAQLEEALAQQRQDRGTPLGEILVRRGVITRADLQTALARKMGYPLVDVGVFPVEMDAVGRLPYAVAHRVVALPLVLRGGRLVVALEDPTRAATIAEIEFAAQTKIVPVLARAGVLAAAVDRCYERLGAEVFARRAPGDAGGGALDFEPQDASHLLAALQQQAAAASGGDDDEQAIEQSDNSLVRLINTMILEAQAGGVSDIHVECAPGREKVRIRFRRDGELRPYLELPHTYRGALIARLKIMCDLDISERRKPQDGKIAFGRFVTGSKLELRVATIPTHNGVEDAVLRLLSSARPLPMDRLGLRPESLARLRELVKRPYGMLLCVGPTGSGKTTTLHSAIGDINVPSRKIWTAEDPIEITQAGLRQVQVNPRIDWTFDKALRAFLRADPDVIMVGEIRDRETAQVAIEASLTGHLVLSTLHTNSAPETVTRLLDMGMDPFNFADALLAVLAQRLVRRICTHCRVETDATPEQLDELLADHLHSTQGAPGAAEPHEVLAGWSQRFARDGRLRLAHGAGCERCGGSGFAGRAAIHELMSTSPRLRELIQTGARSDEIKRHAVGEGMLTLRQDGIEKVLAGVTTIDEVRANSN